MSVRYDKATGEIIRHEFFTYEKTLKPLIQIVQANVKKRADQEDIGNNIREEVDNFLAWDPRENQDHEKAPFFNELMEAAAEFFKSGCTESYDLCKKLQEMIIDFVRREFDVELEKDDVKFEFC